MYEEEEEEEEEEELENGAYDMARHSLTMSLISQADLTAALYDWNNCQELFL